MFLRSLFYDLHYDLTRHIVSFCPDTPESVENYRNALFDDKKDALSVSAITDFGGLECVDSSYSELSENLHLIGPRTRVVHLQHDLDTSLLLDKKLRLHIVKMCPNIEVFYDDYGMFSDEECIGIVRSFPLLSKMFVYCREKMTDASLIEMGNKSKNLKSLVLLAEDDSKVSDVGLTAVLHGCSKIEILAICDYSHDHFTDESYRVISRLSSLQKLNLTSPVVSSETLIQIASGCKNLKNLKVRSDALSNEAFIEVGRLCPEITFLELPWSISPLEVIPAFPNLQKISCFEEIEEDDDPYNRNRMLKKSIWELYPNVEVVFW